LSRSLDLSFNNITDIQAGFFEPLASILKILNLAHNQLRLATASGLGNLRRLVHLDLSHNRLEAVEEMALEMNRDLQRLSLASNLLTSIERQSFRNLRHLVRLDLSRNDLDTLPEGLFEATKLEILSVADNNLLEIPVRALNPVQSSLRQLDLAGNLIIMVSESQLGQIQQLVSLDLSRNNIHSLDSRALCCSPALVHLSLAHNPIQVAHILYCTHIACCAREVVVPTY
jgi:Leucine-rich repeat (LRR) protein